MRDPRRGAAWAPVLGLPGTTDEPAGLDGPDHLTRSRCTGEIHMSV
jgi:hypothetical protein